MPVLARQSDPQFQYVVTDPSKSTGYNPFKAATELYTKMYGKAPLNFSEASVYKPKPALDMLNTTPLAKQQKVKMAMAGGRGNVVESTGALYDRTSGTWTQPVSEDFMRWYAAAQDPGVLNDPVQKAMLDKTAEWLSSKNAGTKEFGKGAMYGGEFDPSMVVFQDEVNKAKKAGASDQELNTLRDELLAKRYAFSRAQQFNPYGYGVGSRGSALNTIHRQYLAEGNTDLDTLLKADPQNYANAVLKGYIEGPNASLRSFDGNAFRAVPSTNRSKTLGGEDLANDVFEYYRSRASDGQAGTNWAATSNPFVLQGTFNNQQAFFTPYDYAVTGRFNPTLDRTQLANLDPNYWLNQGNLQSINNQWGFVTSQDPFAALTDPTRLLDKENTSIRLTKTSGGFLGNLLSPETLTGLAGAFFGVPMLSLPGTIGSGVNFLENYLGNRKSTGGNINFQRPVQSPTWYLPGA